MKEVRKKKKKIYIYISKSLTNHLYLKKEMYQLFIEDGTNIKDYLNSLN